VTSLPVENAPGVGDCWNRIGVRGDRSCPELANVVHCHNCPVFAAAGRRFLDAPSPPGYLEEWTERLASPPETEAGDRVSVLVFRVGEEWLGLPVRAVVEVTPPKPVRRVPHRGGVLAGLVNIRGELHLCVRLGQVLGLTGDGSPSPAGRLVVVEHGGERWAFAADDVDRVRRVPAAEMRPAPPTVNRAQARLTAAVYTRDGRAIGVLDPERLFRALRARAR
jgi:chemotaxis-related protein WspD